MASKPIVISIQGDTSGLSKALKGARGKLKDFGKSVGKFGVASGAVFAATATAAYGVALLGRRLRGGFGVFGGQDSSVK